MFDRIPNTPLRVTFSSVSLIVLLNKLFLVLLLLIWYWEATNYKLTIKKRKIIFNPIEQPGVKIIIKCSWLRRHKVSRPFTATVRRDRIFVQFEAQFFCVSHMILLSVSQDPGLVFRFSS